MSTDTISDVLVTCNELLCTFDRKRVSVAIYDNVVLLGKQNTLTIDQIQESGDAGIKWFSSNYVLYPTFTNYAEVYKYSADENDMSGGNSTGIEYWVLKDKNIVTYFSVTSANVKLWQVRVRKGYNYIYVLSRIIMDDPECMFYVNCIDKRFDIMLPAGYRNVFMYGVIKTSYHHSEIVKPPTCPTNQEPTTSTTESITTTIVPAR